MQCNLLNAIANPYMRKLTLIMLFFSLKNLAQDTILKSNPVLYGEMIFGFGGNFNDYGGFIYGGNVNYQVKKNLFTIRYNVHPEFNYGAASIAAVGLPVIQSRFTNTEVGLLYGRRYSVRGRSLSFAGGISTNEYETQYKTEDSGTTSYYKVVQAKKRAIQDIRNISGWQTGRLRPKLWI